MKREVRLFWLMLAAVAIASYAGCRHKPAYSDIDANKASSPQNRNGAVQAVATPSAETPEGTTAQPPPTPSAKPPRFMDQTKGTIKDLPSYPHARTVNVQFGPNQGVNVMALVLQTNDPMDMITAFYEQAIKTNEWTVIDKTLDSEESHWNLKKGEENSAKIQVKNDLTTGRKNILIARVEKLEETSK